MMNICNYLYDHVVRTRKIINVFVCCVSQSNSIQQDYLSYMF